MLEWDTEVEYVPVQWLWRDWLVRGNLNVLAGDGGVGKTHFAVGLAARLSRGDLPGDHQGTPGRTLYLSAEDDFASHPKRLYRAAGGVPGRFGRMKVPAGEWLDDPSFPDDLPELRRLVREEGISLLVIDPGAAFFSVRDSHNDQQMRSRVFSPLASIAMAENVTVLYLAHLNKGGGTFRQRINGAVGISNAPRSVIGMARDPDHDHRNIVAHVKGNLAKPPGSLIFEFVQTPVTIDGQDAPATMLKLVGTTGMSADDLVAPKERRQQGGGGGRTRPRGARRRAGSLRRAPAARPGARDQRGHPRRGPPPRGRCLAPPRQVVGDRLPAPVRGSWQTPRTTDSRSRAPSSSQTQVTSSSRRCDREPQARSGFTACRASRRARRRPQGRAGRGLARPRAVGGRPPGPSTRSPRGAGAAHGRAGP